METQNLSSAYSTVRTHIVEFSNIKGKTKQYDKLVFILNQMQDALLETKTLQPHEFLKLANLIKASNSDKNIHTQLQTCVTRCLENYNVSVGNDPQAQPKLSKTMALMPRMLMMPPRTLYTIPSTSTSSSSTESHTTPEARHVSFPGTPASPELPETSATFKQFATSINETKQINPPKRRYDRVARLITELSNAVAGPTNGGVLTPAEVVELATSIQEAALPSQSLCRDIQKCVETCLNKLTTSPMTPRAETPQTPDWLLDDEDNSTTTTTTTTSTSQSETEPRRSNRIKIKPEFFTPTTAASSPGISRKRNRDELNLETPTKRPRVASPAPITEYSSDIDSDIDIEGSDEEDSDVDTTAFPRVQAAILSHNFASEFPFLPSDPVKLQICQILVSALLPIVNKNPEYASPEQQHHLTAAILKSTKIRNNIAAVIFWRFDELMRTNPLEATAFRETLVGFQPPVEDGDNTQLFAMSRPTSVEWFRQLVLHINVIKAEYGCVYQVFHDITQRSLLHVTRQDVDDEEEQLSYAEKQALTSLFSARMHRYLSGYHALASEKQCPIDTFLSWIEHNKNLNVFNWPVLRLQYLLNEDPKGRDDAVALAKIQTWLDARMPPSHLYT
ncbi:MAG: hypothetical protein Q8K75_08975 [Chlamydiales bacterium]|nr:hypothetical protein [Chlamydiales bacterium]